MVRAFILCVSFLACARAGVVVGVLGDHKPDGWSKSSGCTSGADLDLIECNLRVYNTTAAEAKAQGVQLLLFPEAYALAPSLSETSFSEPLLGALGAVPCTAANASASSPQQAALSCIALRNALPLAANVFTTLPNGTRHITELVYDGRGALLALYHKHHLFPTETKSVSAGPFAPTTFELLGRTWGIIICYEGVYPVVTGDYAQMDALKRMGASAFIWSIGSDAPMATISKSWGKKYLTAVSAAIDGNLLDGTGAIVAPGGTEVAYTDTVLASLSAVGYTAKAKLRVGSLP